MAPQQKIVTNDIGRVFIQRANEQLGNCPEYYGCVGISGITQNREATVKIKCPSDKVAGQYDVVHKITGDLEDITFDMTGYLGMQGMSILRELFQDNCDATVHLHFGTCTNVQDFRTFEKALVLEGVNFTSYGTDDVITLDSANRNVITETASAEASGMYEYFNVKKFTAIGVMDSTDPINIHMIASECSLCIFCNSTEPLECVQDFYSIEQDDELVYSFNSSTNVYTVSTTGQIKVWDYDLIAEGTLSCFAITTLALDLNEDVTSAAYNYDTGILLIGTSLGKVIYYDTVLQTAQVVYVGPNSIDVMSANKHGYLFADSTGNMYYSLNADNWEGPTNTTSGSVEALLLYSSVSWLVSNTNGNMYYTNNVGKNYTQKPYPLVQGEYIKEFEQTNQAILHAITNTRYYQSFDSGCNWQSIDLSKYFSQIYSMELCPTNPYIIYFAGLNLAGTQSLIVKLNFGA